MPRNGDVTDDGGFALRPTPLLRAGDDVPLQVCRLTVADRPVAADAMLRARREGAVFSFPLRLAAGTSEHEIVLPEATGPCRAEVELEVGEERRTTEVGFGPVRRWQVFLVNHSHTDIGFTHPPSDVAEVHTKNLRTALELAEATADWPDDARFRWTCESAWQVQNYLRAFPNDAHRLAEAIRAGSVEVEALYIHSYFDLLSREQLARSLSYAEGLRRGLGVPITSAMINDVPGCPWSLVDLLAESGVPYLAMGPNNFIAPFHALSDLTRPFVWRGPAGRRVLVWFTDDPFHSYTEGAGYGLWDGIEAVEAKLPAKLAELEADGYPYDAVQIQSSHDNWPVRFAPSLIAREWNRRYASPRLRLATPTTFFRHIDARWFDRFPVVGGEWQHNWSQTTLQYPREANASRRNHAVLDAWERLAVVADWINEAFPYPRAELAAAYDASLLFDEHSGPKGIWYPRSDAEAARALAEGYDLFERATLPAARGLDAALAAATGALRTMGAGEEPNIVVWNPLGWPRDGAVEVDVPAEWVGPTAALVDETTGQSVPFEARPAAGDGQVRCRVACSGVPALGYKRYRLVANGAGGAPAARPAPAAHVRGDEAVLESDRFAVIVDATGNVTRLVDLGTGADLVDRAAGPGLNALVRYLPEPHGPGAERDFHADRSVYLGTPVEGRVLDAEAVPAGEPVAGSGLGFASVRVEAVFAGTYRRRVEVRLYDGWVEVRNRLRWLRRPADPEVLYLAFPFALAAPRVRHTAQHVVVDPHAQTLSGSSLDAFAIQGWLDLSTEERGVTLCSGDLPLVDYGGVHFQRFLRRLPPPTGLVAFRLAMGQALPTADGLPFGREGVVDADFAIRPYAGPFDPLAAHRFGEERTLPLRAAPLPTNHPGEWRDPAAGFVDLLSPSVVFTGLKRAEHDDGYVVRLWEAAGRRSLARLSFPHHTLLAAWRVTPVEGDLGRVEPSGDDLLVELGPFETAAFRVVLGR